MPPDRHEPLSRVLEMERDDLVALIIGHPGTDQVDAILYDPMPGGSGLLQQALIRWSEVVAAATEVASDCPADCHRSCPDSLQTFRNAYYHAHLERPAALERLQQFGTAIQVAHSIPAETGAAAHEGTPVNLAEALLHHLIAKAGLPLGRW